MSSYEKKEIEKEIEKVMLCGLIQGILDIWTFTPLLKTYNQTLYMEI